MQTRKRAKSITFGKSDKPKEPSHHKVVEEKPKEAAPLILETHEIEEKEHVLSDSLVGDLKTAEKGTVVERRAVPDKPAAEATPPPSQPPLTVVTPPETPPAITPAADFLTDTQPTATVISEETPAPVASEPLSPVSQPEATLSPVEPVMSPEVPPSPDVTAAPVTPTPSEELSATPPPSAFTIQGNNVDAPDAPEGKKRHFALYFIVIALLAFTLGLGAMAAVSYGFINVGLPKQLPSKLFSFMKPLTPATPTPTPKPAPTVTPTAKPVDLKAYTISVLNGSGVVGKAAAVKTTLTTDGFKVGTTGNADRSDYTNTQLTVKSSVDKAYVTQLETELKKSFVLDSTSTIPSSSASEPDVVVTIGKAAAK